VAARERERPEGSYTTALFAAGVARIAQKVGEEGVEVALAAVTRDDDALLAESADLLFHLAVLLRASGRSLEDAIAVLGGRLPRAAACSSANSSGSSNSGGDSAGSAGSSSE
jgi:phosphoribosyl-ATP pyrophosphohydrolase/phosphoribosyl-AMP cyclohydrolase